MENKLNNLTLDNNLIKLAKAIAKNNGNLYIVGGYIRNYFLDLKNTDLDICGDLTYDKVLEIALSLGFDAHIINKKLGTVLIKTDTDEYEYTTFRKENYTTGGAHSPTDVSFVSDIKLDASRRDFSVNALYYNINTGEILDFYEGLGDLSNKSLKCIKTPEEVFESDGLRILRLIRIASELGFDIEKRTKECAKTYSHQLKDITPERVLKELKKIVVSDFKYDTTPFKENFLDNFNYIQLFKHVLGPNFDNFKIKSNYRKNFFDLPKHFRYAGFCMLFLANYFKFKHMPTPQVQWACNYIFGNSGLRDSAKDVTTIFASYSLIQEILFNKKNRYKHFLHNFYNADSEIKKFIEAFLPKEYAKIMLDIKLLLAKNIPLSFEELNISNLELINIARIDKHKTSKIKARLLLSCLNEDLANTKNNLIIEARYLNIKLENL
ncbi:MAG: CCA tRNA nucleotidyltransferase [Clostridia bacterium]|nr:CCA tRNA nucleotidyltransferase [Clostridia bacterium]